MKKTICIPLVLGGVLDVLDFASWAGNFAIPLGPYGATGPQEVFITMSAALGGPLSLSVTCILHELGNYSFGLNALFSPDQISSVGTLYTIADFSAHILAALSVAYCYKILHQHSKNVYVFFGGWSLVTIVYYVLLVSLQFYLIGFVINLPPLSALFRDFLPEFLVVLIITILLWIALPRRYHRPLWIDVQLAASPIVDRA